MRRAVSRRVGTSSVNGENYYRPRRILAVELHRTGLARLIASVNR